MKIGDTVPVTIAGQEVARATVKGMEDGTATLVVPATLVVMATRTELTVDSPDDEGTEVLVTGVDRAGQENAETGAVNEAELNAEAPPAEINEAVTAPNSESNDSVLQGNNEVLQSNVGE